ncbi:hypothetical protein IJ556_03730, partial [bacterium]|nr:hypothetical protein [bacterium]
MKNTSQTFKKITSLFLSLVLIASALSAVDLSALATYSAKITQWNTVASSDFTKSVDGNGQYPTYSTGGNQLGWTISGSSSRAESDNAISIPDGYMYMSKYNNQTSTSPLPGGTKAWKIDFGFRFKDNISKPSEDQYCFLRMGVFTSAFADANTTMYQATYFSQDACGKVNAWDPPSVGTDSADTSLTTDSSNLQVGVNYHYIAEYDGTRCLVYIENENGRAVQQILNTTDSTFIGHMNNLTTSLWGCYISDIKIGNTQPSGNKYSNL